MTTAAPPRPITDRQAEVLSAIVAGITRDGRPPSIRELVAALGGGSTNAVACHLAPLVRKGYLAPAASAARSFRVLRLPDGRPIAGWAPITPEEAP